MEHRKLYSEDFAFVVIACLGTRSVLFWAYEEVCWTVCSTRTVTPSNNGIVAQSLIIANEAKMNRNCFCRHSNKTLEILFLFSVCFPLQRFSSSFRRFNIFTDEEFFFCSFHWSCLFVYNWAQCDTDSRYDHWYISYSTVLNTSLYLLKYSI